MTEPLALYAAVMGRLWEDERLRGQRQARIEARLAGRRQGGGTGSRGSARDMLKAASRESRAAIFKRIRSGGCKTRVSLSHQLAYVSDKAVYTYSTMTNPLRTGASLSTAQKAEIVAAWAETWRGTTKLGFTSHMLLSFPKEVSVAQAREIALDWGEHFFESGAYGDRWDYVLAVHDDRAHKHAHIVLNNRGTEAGTWFSCWAEGVMSPQLMREKQAEIAERHGVMLEATRRLERGIFTRAAGIEEIYRAKAEARLPREIALSPEEKAIAQAQVAGFAEGYRALADVLQVMDKRPLAQAMRRVAASLGTGTVYQLDEGEIDMETIRTVGDAIAQAEKTIEALRLKAEELGPDMRPGFEIRAAPVIRDLSKMVPDPELRARFARDLTEPYPPGSGVARFAAAYAGSDPVLDRLKAHMEKVGLDGAEMAARIAAGGTTHYGLAQDWVTRDMEAILARDGLTLARASEAQQAAALETVDQVMEGLLARARALGLGGEGAASDLADREGRDPRSPLQGLADLLRAGPLGAPQAERVTRELRGELARTLGEDELGALRRGQYEVLAEALPDPLDRIIVTQSFLEMTSAETGSRVFSERASALQQDKAEALARQTRLEMHRGRESARDAGEEFGL
ncbi:T-DNA border endonuclease [Roseivivax halodurans JCM 10272]|uniref:T-DNA border endonuclease n=1 Tax=Roseivivax halodurans JCM 10272 TaxID=1449350 RepID=X7EC46_9RHOB|nr:relaxase/mobilization nuclease domain-containing protein [Roseivivax halodurans]ETX13507.1 T-DNA border endonuclease [Roseivivax halodurans JCM 10272]